MTWSQGWSPDAGRLAEAWLSKAGGGAATGTWMRPTVLSSGGAGEKWVPPTLSSLLRKNPRGKELLGASPRHKLPSLVGDLTVPSMQKMLSKCLGQMNEHLGGHRGPFWLGNSERQRGRCLWFCLMQQITHLLSARSCATCWVGSQGFKDSNSEELRGCGHEGVVSGTDTGHYPQLKWAGTR